MRSYRLPPGLLGLALFLTFTACGPDELAPADPLTPSRSTAEPESPREVDPIPKFDRDSAYAYVAKQVDFGPRVMNTPAHDETRDWLAQKLREFGAEVELQSFDATAFDGTILKSTNVIGRYHPERTDRVALYAHWDTRPFADSPLEDDPAAVVNGADDGASGVGVLLEIARQLQSSDPGIGVDIVLLDAEDYGTSANTNSWGLGAQHYARNLTDPRPAFGILLDMVGAKDARFPREGFSVKYAPRIVDRVWKLGQSMGYDRYFVDEDGGGVTDDHYFINTIANVPTIDIINRRTDTPTGFVAHWHTDDDDLDTIDRRTLRATGQVVLATLFRYGARTL